ncbi:autotransporter domain-containing protein [Uliginosibacterium sp. H3]|uniref:Autotransporter domain-containing protein n=1 Tax=Uliginosibacterium silvisoli TaxID=3114758 RepID=A0ABU6K542_9RHOO|nr:autotransporter domain-containing protein [Uliginosibacterium sp. H3]
MSVALTAALAMMASAEVRAACITLSSNATVTGPTSTCLTWAGGNLSLTNNGTLNGPSSPQVEATGSLPGTLTNRGLISGASIGVLNSGTISLLNNNGGRITGATSAISLGSGSRITSLFNNVNGTLTGTISGQTAILSSGGTIGTLTNNGLIGGTTRGISMLSGANFTSLLNNTGGTISGPTAISASNSTIGTLTNTGRITGTTLGIKLVSAASITSLINNAGGTISGPTAILSSAGTIGTLTNTGLISGSSFALNGVFGTIANNGGTIAGNIQGTSGSPLTITGGTGSTFGTLTGSGSSIGTITNTSSNLVFSSGNLLLNDHINVGSNTVTNSGATLQVNNTIAITGNYTQNAGATLNIGVANGAVTTGVVSADSGYGRLVISGVATFNAGSGVALKKLSSYAFAQGQRFVVAQANNGSANFNASALNYSADSYSGGIYGTSVTDSDDSTKTDLVVTLGTPPPAPTPTPTPTPSATTPIIAATTPDAVSSLSGLFRYGGTNADMLNMFNAAAALGATAEANRAGAQLSPAANTASTVQSAQAPTQAVVDVASSRVDMLRTAQVAGSGVSTGEQGSNIASWGQAFGGKANQSDRSDTSGYRAGYSGLLIGADTAINPQWRVGGLINYANTSVDATGDNTGSSSHIKGYGLLGYGGYTAERWYLNLSGGAVKQKYDTQRSVSYTGFSGNATGQYEGTQYIASGLAGFPVKLDTAMTLTPITGLTWSHLIQEAYTETGSTAALHVNATSATSLRSDLGAKLERTFKTSYGEITPIALVSWRHEFRDTSVQSVANFAADTSGATSFTTRGSTGQADTGVLVLGATLARSQNLTLAAHYTLNAANGYTSQTADLRLRYEF